MAAARLCGGGDWSAIGRAAELTGAGPGQQPITHNGRRSVAIMFDDLVGKLDVLMIKCAKRDRINLTFVKLRTGELTLRKYRKLEI
jgi:hypothetical protein